MNTGLTVINEKVARESAFIAVLIQEMRKVIVGQDYLLNRLLVGILANGHVSWLRSVPGLAKTLSIKTLSRAINTKFQRIQFT